MSASVSFEVEEAGCGSCIDRVRAALSVLGELEHIGIDGDADRARVRMRGAPAQEAVAAALVQASEGSGHAYRIREGSWRSD